MTTAPETPLRVLFVLEANLGVLNPEDAASQVAAIAKRLGRMRDRELPSVVNLRIALDEPGGAQTATAVVRYLEGTERHTGRIGS